MKFSLIWKLFTALILSALIVACGGGGGGGASSGSSAGVSSGVISGFGSVVVNGVKFDDNGTDILVVDGDDSSSNDDRVGSRSDLEVGMVVEVENESRGNSQHANQIRVEDVVKGQIQTVDAVNGTLLVLGQTIIVDSQTSFTGRDSGGVLITDITGFAGSDYVEVSGFSKPDGSILATLIQKKTYQAGVSTLKVKGKINTLASTTFTINAQTIDFLSAPALIKPNGTNLKAGDFVVVKTKLTPAALGDTLIAQKIKVKNNRLQVRDGHKIEVEGIIESIDLVNKTIVINGITIDASSLSNLGALSAGQKIEVEGVLVNGVLIPSKSKNEQESTIRMEAPIQALSSTSVTVLGQVFNVNAFTRFEDKVSGTRPFNVENFATVLQTGDRIAIRAIQDANGGLIATRLERIEPRSGVLVQGPVTAKTPSTALTILGVTVNILPDTQFRGTTSSAIFNDAQTPLQTLLKAKGVAPSDTTNVINATEIEVENHNSD